MQISLANVLKTTSNLNVNVHVIHPKSYARWHMQHNF